MSVPLEQAASAWAHGWSITRGTPAPRPVRGGVMIEVGTPGQMSRHVLWDVSPSVMAETMTAIDKPGCFIKACAPRAQVEPLTRDSAWIVDDQVWMMEAPSPPTLPQALADGFEIAIAWQAECIVATGHAPDGTLPARGKAALAGGFLVFDQIVTEPSCRRRGLGTSIMAALTNAGQGSAPHGGLLVATEEGARLYEALGWRHLTPVTSLVIPEPCR